MAKSTVDSYISHIGKIIDLIKEREFTKAKEQCKEAKEEIEEIKTNININDQRKIKCIEPFIDDVSRGTQIGVTHEINTAWKCIERFYKEEDRKLQSRRQSKPDVCKAKGTAKTNYQEADGKAKEDDQRHLIENSPEHEYPQGIASVATAFREMFDDEWADAYEELDDKNMKEKEKVQVLLEVVQKAYNFNKWMKDKQVTDAEREAKRIVAGKESPQNIPLVPKGEKDILVRYLYENALVALPGLQERFYEEIITSFTRKWKQHFNKNGIRFELKKGFNEYIVKCVTITWLLCIEEPPIHMLFGKTEKKFDAQFYEPFTRKGETIEFIVWPALVHKEMDGDVLVKGKAQGK